MDTDPFDIIAAASAIARAAWRKRLERERQLVATLASYTLAFDRLDHEACQIILAAAQHDLELMELIEEFHCGIDLHFPD